MIEKKVEKLRSDQKVRDDGVELENQFILRLPEEPAKVLREAIQTGNLKDRMTIKLDNDLRHGEVRLDHWLLYAKVVDLPTIIECLKTIDNKSFYKSADICQLMICKEELEEESEKESPNKVKKKDPNKVDKKYLWPHGITPPCKNVRKRRFRKTLKKKNVEAPEIEKEVKHLLRFDNEAVRVDYEIINEELEKTSLDLSDSKDFNEEEFINLKDPETNLNESNVKLSNESEEEETTEYEKKTLPIKKVVERDIFGAALSSSDDDDDANPHTTQTMRHHELEDGTRLSADDSHMSDFFTGGTSSNTVANNNQNKGESNEFIKFNEANSPKSDRYSGSNSNLAAPNDFFDSQSQSQAQIRVKQDNIFEENTSEATVQPQLSIAELNNKISQLHRQISNLKMQQHQKAQEIGSIQNATLKQRLQEAMENIFRQLTQKESEVKDYENMLDAQLA